MIDAFAIVDRLSTYTLGGLVTLILICSYFKVWVWWSVVQDLIAANTLRIAEMKTEHATAMAEFKAACETARIEMRADYEQRYAKWEASNAKWERMALRGVGLAEVGINLAKQTDIS